MMLEGTLADAEKLEQGVDGVLSALLHDESVAWVRDSALTERAFLIGANKFASAVFPGQDGKLLQLALARTLWARQGDDPFSASEMGKLYSDLLSQLDSYCSSVLREEAGVDFPEEPLNKMRDLVDRLSEQNRSALDACRHYISQISHLSLELNDTFAANREGIKRIYDNARWLEEPLRFLSGSKAP
jgi:hypothetical protein